MNEVTINVDKGGLAGFFVNQVGVPDRTGSVATWGLQVLPVKWELEL